MAPYIISLIFLGNAVILIFFPRTVRKYDRSTASRYIQDEDEYVAYCRVFGILFFLMAFVPIAFRGYMQ